MNVGQPSGATVHVVGPNPAVDRLQMVPGLLVGEVNRATEVITRPGGKGMIVARGVVRLGGRAALHGFTGGRAGELIAEGCREAGVTDHHVRIDGETRTTTVIVDRVAGTSTVVNEPGPLVDAAQVVSLVDGLLAAVRSEDVVVCTGSLPRGVPGDLYAGLVAPLRDRGVRTLVDTSGEALAAAVRAAPDVLKVNEHELRTDAGLTLDGDDDLDLETLMRRALAAGVRSVVVTRGAAGLSYRSTTRRVDVAAPAVTVVNATGSGDLMLAGFVTSLAAGDDLETALVLGTATGAANAAQLSPDLPDRSEVDRLRALARVTTSVESDT